MVSSWNRVMLIRSDAAFSGFGYLISSPTVAQPFSMMKSGIHAPHSSPGVTAHPNDSHILR
jgi:hypothetical protein